MSRAIARPRPASSVAPPAFQTNTVPTPPPASQVKPFERGNAVPRPANEVKPFERGNAVPRPTKPEASPAPLEVGRINGVPVIDPFSRPAPPKSRLEDAFDNAANKAFDKLFPNTKPQLEPELARRNAQQPEDDPANQRPPVPVGTEYEIYWYVGSESAKTKALIVSHNFGGIETIRGERRGRITARTINGESYQAFFNPDEDYGVSNFTPQPQPQPQPQPVPDAPGFPRPVYIPEPQPSPSPQPQPKPQPNPAPKPQPKPAPSPQPTPQPQPQPQPNPNPLPNPQPKPVPIPAPGGNPSPAPAPAPGGKPSPGGNPSPSPSPGGKPSPSPSPYPAPNPTGQPYPQPQPPAQPPQTKRDRCQDDPCVADIQRTLDDLTNPNNPNQSEPPKRKTISVDVFDSCDGETAKFKAVSVEVEESNEALIKLQFERLKAIESLQCKDNDCHAAIPEWWAVRVGADRPQLVVKFGDYNPATQKVGRSRWSMAIPHPLNPNARPTIPIYRKGNFFAILTLTDNSELKVNCFSKEEAERVINILIPLINPAFLPVGRLVYYGERRGSPLSNAFVKPVACLYFSTGQRNLRPDNELDPIVV